uniref:PBP domain-containing protein n=1 Tax=Dunaliella tertiolecta TaxID=3047 RepID=A0A7S3VTW4_DUNTE|eukprot:CAMPEP_0202338874 /NCGR_PEP_ID=MMETSP1126-20121109/980_1 /ASSEMBLY_ACC=CAM_ASM_000457 /TAXON_ID=3047 /ORGANISM="Dunaliella tertiolecta, Strain CCMP1320" /LENGTH=940 /DNA_ID=CAMNT_0048929349 /DNA_START=180 /DNA_END=3002 /DNA_ORIENTATION=+
MTIFLLALLATVVRAQVAELTLAGSAGGSEYGRKLMAAVEDMASGPVRTVYREVPNDQKARDEFNPGAIPKAALSSAPLVPSAGEPAVLNIPVAFSTLSIYANVPGVLETINMTSCLLARIFDGQLTNWNQRDIRAINPGMSLAGEKTKTNILVVRPKDTQSQSGIYENTDTATLKAYLQASCPEVAGQGGWKGAYVSRLVGTSDALVDDPLMVASKNPMSITYSRTAEITASGPSVREVGIQNKANTYQRAANADYANTIKAIGDRLPWSFDSSDYSVADLSAVNAWDMPGEGVFPMTVVHFIHAPKDVSADPWDRNNTGALLQAICNFAVSEAGWALIDGTGLHPLADFDIAARSMAALNQSSTPPNMILGTQPQYQLELKGTYTENLESPSLSASREGYCYTQLQRLKEKDVEFEQQMRLNQNTVLQGSGSSAQTAVMWRLMRNFMASSSTPVWLYYRAIGSGGGQDESTGSNNNYNPWNNFGVSDVPLSTAVWKIIHKDSIVAARGKPIQVPYGLSAMSFFVSIPQIALPEGKMRLTPCDIVKIFTGKVTSWSGFGLAAKDVTFFYRVQSGSTALISSYLSEACPAEWTFSKAGNMTIKEWESMDNGRVADNTLDLANKLAATPWAIGYMDSGIGQNFATLVEVSLQNSAGQFLTSRESEISEAASGVIRSGAWPADPTSDFSGVSLINQPGDRTWPIVVMPFIIAHTNLVDLGSKGSLMVAFLKYMLEPEVQKGLKEENMEPLPAEVMNYVKTRILPLLMVDPKAPQWFYEGDHTIYDGSKPYVYSAPDINSDYNLLQMTRMKEGLGNVERWIRNIEARDLPSSLNATIIQFNSDLEHVRKTLDDRVKEYQALSIAGIAFGIAGSVIAIFTVFRSIAKDMEGGSGGLMSTGMLGSIPGISTGGDLRRKPSALEDGLMPLNSGRAQSGSGHHSGME